MASLADTLRSLGGTGEVLGTVGSGIAAQVPAGLAGSAEFLRQLAMTRSLDQAREAAAKRVEGVTENLTYEPRSTSGREQLGALGEGIGAAGEQLMKLPGARAAGEGWEKFSMAAPALAATVRGGAEIVGPGKFKPKGAALEAAAVKGGKMAEILREGKAPGIPVSSETGPILPRRPGGYEAQHLPAEQKPLPRLTPTGETPELNERSAALLRSKKAADAVDAQIAKGRDTSQKYNTDLEHYYGHAPLYDFSLNEGLSPEEFERMVAHFSGGSQRNRVLQENRMGSYLWGLDRRGELTPEKRLWTKKVGEDEGIPRGTPGFIELPPKYGSLAQGDIFRRSQDLAMGATPEEIFADKIMSYHTNKLGNQTPVVIDVNALHGPAMQARLSAWLKSTLDPQTRAKSGGIMRPRDEYASGKLTMKEALTRPGIWEDAPGSPGEYAAWEKLHTRGADRASARPAGGQALGWFGSNDFTDLKTPPGTAMELMEIGARKSAQENRITPIEAMRGMVRGARGRQLGFIDPKLLAAVGGAGIAATVAWPLIKALRERGSRIEEATKAVEEQNNPDRTNRRKAIDKAEAEATR